MMDNRSQINMYYIETCIAHIRWYLEHAMKAYETEEFTSGDMVFKGRDALAYKCGAMSVNIESALQTLSYIENELKEGDNDKERSENRNDGEAEK